MALAQYQKANFETLTMAFKNGDVALMECTDNNGNPVPVVCAVQRDGNEYVFVPLAKLFVDNPYDEVNPPPVKMNIAENNSEFLARFGLTFEELREYSDLKRKIYGPNDSPVKALFVVLDDDNKDHQRYNELSGKVIKLNAYLIAHRND